VRASGDVIISDLRCVAEVSRIERPLGVEQFAVMLLRLLEAHKFILHGVREGITKAAALQNHTTNDLLASEVLRTYELQG
jgi:starvation-inducible DNA-binding protein